MSEDIRQKILYLRDVMKLSFYQIEDMTGVCRKKASKIYKGHCPGTRQGKPCKLEQYRSLIGTWFHEYPSLRAWQVYEMLKERGVKVSYELVTKYTKGFREKKDKVYHCLTFLAGEEAHVVKFYNGG